MIRKAEKSDIPRIAEILIFGKRVAYRSIFQNDAVSFNEMQVWTLANRYIDAPDQINDMLVYDDGIVKGVINPVILGQELEIRDFFVEPFFKGNGIGSQLLSYVICEGRRKHLKRVYLWVLEENVAAREFYEHHELQASGLTVNDDGTDKTLLCYELLL